MRWLAFCAILLLGGKFAQAQTDAPPGYSWRDGVACQDLSFKSIQTTRYESIHQQSVSGMVTHTGRDPVKNVSVCGGGACTVVYAGLVMQKGQSAQFYLSVPNLDQVVLTVECSVLQRQ